MKDTDSAGRAYWVVKPGESLPLDRTEAERRWQAGIDGHLQPELAARVVEAVNKEQRT